MKFCVECTSRSRKWTFDEKSWFFIIFGVKNLLFVCNLMPWMVPGWRSWHPGKCKKCQNFPKIYLWKHQQISKKKKKIEKQIYAILVFFLISKVEVFTNFIFLKCWHFWHVSGMSRSSSRDHPGHQITHK